MATDPLETRICRLCFIGQLSLVSIYDECQANIPEMLSEHIGEVDILASYLCKKAVHIACLSYPVGHFMHFRARHFPPGERGRRAAKVHLHQMPGQGERFPRISS